jgi:hypothetical protein
MAALFYFKIEENNLSYIRIINKGNDYSHILEII